MHADLRMSEKKGFSVWVTWVNGFLGECEALMGENRKEAEEEEEEDGRERKGTEENGVVEWW